MALRGVGAAGVSAAMRVFDCLVLLRKLSLTVSSTLLRRASWNASAGKEPRLCGRVEHERLHGNGKGSVILLSFRKSFAVFHNPLPADEGMYFEAVCGCTGVKPRRGTRIMRIQDRIHGRHSHCAYHQV